MQQSLRAVSCSGKREAAGAAAGLRQPFYVIARLIARHRRAALAGIQKCSSMENSGERLGRVLSLIHSAPAEVFWPALMEAWSCCDDTWPIKVQLLRSMPNVAKPATPYFSAAQMEFWRKLPPEVPIFRGCPRDRVRGIAWTTDRSVAEGFARGHRGISTPNPVVASAVVAKQHVFFVTNDRKEHEVVLNPRRLRKLRVEPYRLIN